MDAPKSLDQFNEQLAKHFEIFPRLSSKIIKVRDHRFHAKINDKDILARQFRVLNNNSMDFA